MLLVQSAVDVAHSEFKVATLLYLSQVLWAGERCTMGQTEKKEKYFWVSLISNKYTHSGFRDLEAVGTALAEWVQGQSAERGSSRCSPHL